MKGPDKNVKFPLENYDKLCFLKNIVKNPNVIVGEYTYYDDFENVEPYTLVGGNPAQLIRKRFSDDIIERLLKLERWNWEIDRITRNVQYLTDTDIDKLEQNK